MGGTHQHPDVNFRAPRDVREAATAAVAAAGWTKQDLLLACLYAARDDTEALLALLTPHRQPPGRRGRPRRQAKNHG